MITVPSAPLIVNPVFKPARRPFGLGVFPQRPERLPVGPSPLDGWLITSATPSAATAKTLPRPPG